LALHLQHPPHDPLEQQKKVDCSVRHELLFLWYLPQRHLYPWPPMTATAKGPYLWASPSEMYVLKRDWHC